MKENGAKGGTYFNAIEDSIKQLPGQLTNTEPQMVKICRINKKMRTGALEWDQG